MPVVMLIWANVDAVSNPDLECNGNALVMLLNFPRELVLL